MTTLLDRKAAIADSADVLSRAMDDDCNLAIWERAALSNVEVLLEGEVRNVRFDTSCAELRGDLENALNAAGYPANGVRNDFAADIELLANLYGDALGLERMNVRVEVIKTDACRKWHADFVRARLITTYVGTGTQWLDQDDADRVREGMEPLRPHTMKSGDVGIFCGKTGCDTPIIHRSPPIAGTGETRLLAVFNPPEDR